MTSYIETVWSCRWFWLSLVLMDLRGRYRRSFLGLGWSLLQPLAMASVLCMVFPVVFQLKPSEYGPFLLCGLCFWNYFQGVTTLGCHCLRQGEAYIRQHPAPLAIYPLRCALGAAFHFLVSLSFTLLLVWVLRGMGNLSALPALIPTVLMLMVLGWAMAVLMGLANVYFPDTQHLVEVGMQILFFATPIVYPLSQLEARGFARLLELNPLTSLVALIRQPILDGQIPALSTYMTGFSLTLFLVCCAGLALSKFERRLIFHL